MYRLVNGPQLLAGSRRRRARNDEQAQWRTASIHISTGIAPVGRDISFLTQS
ncbi:hypothetical protein [Bradyrhizobium centrolobii]|uniref:hypothetical protein n=1 Tax=Bradyrhizobium centrolobii TaxID=1505087 RepID=UPI0013747F49|nr:hypothetical protein [Bradyrhizobium centrolobii]